MANQRRPRPRGSQKRGLALLSAIAVLGGLLCTAASVAQPVEEKKPDGSAAPSQTDGPREGAGAQNAETRERSVLGVLIGSSSGGKGVVIQDVAPGSPADKAGLRVGDEIQLCDGEKIESQESLMNLLGKKPAGSEVEMRVLREGQQMDVKATLMAAQDIYQSRRSAFRGTGEPTGADKRPWLGIALEQTADPQGAKVSAVYPGGPASRAGLRDGDVITRVGDQPVSSPKELAAIVEGKAPDSDLEFTILREGTEQKLTARVGARMLFAEPQGKTFADEKEGAESEDQSRPFDRDEMLGSLPEHVIVLEQNRHLCVQNERLEKLLLQVMEDVQALRDEVAGLKNGAKSAATTAPEQENPAGQADHPAGSGAPAPKAE